MVLFVVCLLALYAGFGSIIYGVYINTDWGAMLSEAIKGSGMHPGNVWIIVGIGLVVAASIVLVIREYRRGKRRYY